MKRTAFAIIAIALIAFACTLQGTPQDLAQYCTQSIGKVYSCDNGYVKLEYDNLGGGISWMIPGDPSAIIRCPVVGPDSMSDTCKNLMNNPPNCTLAVTCPQNPNNGTLVGNDKDEHGCIPSAGYSWCEAKQKCIRPWEENCSGAQMANPASTNCVDKGGALEIRDTPQGQIGVCLINGSECEEWALFRGEGCVSPGGEQAGFTECPAERPTGPVACTMEWMPVCGKIILNMGDTVYQTFGNKCSACAAMKVIGYTQGECPTPNYVECNHAIARGEMCTTNYNPVCAQKDNGIRCIRAPCPSTDNVTYSNGCEACKDEKVYGYVPGACEGAKPTGNLAVREQVVCATPEDTARAENFGLSCVDKCPEDIYMGQIGMQFCIPRYGQAEISQWTQCTKRSDCSSEATCAYTPRGTDGKTLAWSLVKDSNGQPKDALRCVPQAYASYLLQSNGLTMVDEDGKATTAIA